MDLAFAGSNRAWERAPGGVEGHCRGSIEPLASIGEAPGGSVPPSKAADTTTRRTTRSHVYRFFAIGLLLASLTTLPAQAQASSLPLQKWRCRTAGVLSLARLGAVQLRDGRRKRRSQRVAALQGHELGLPRPGRRRDVRLDAGETVRHPGCGRQEIPSQDLSESLPRVVADFERRPEPWRASRHRSRRRVVLRYV